MKPLTSAACSGISVKAGEDGDQSGIVGPRGFPSLQLLAKPRDLGVLITHVSKCYLCGWAQTAMEQATGSGCPTVCVCNRGMQSVIGTHYWALPGVCGSESLGWHPKFCIPREPLRITVAAGSATALREPLF